MTSKLPNSIEETQELLEGGDYICDRSLATVLFLALKMGRPLFLEGEAGVGKTEIAKVLAGTLGCSQLVVQRSFKRCAYAVTDTAQPLYRFVAEHNPNELVGILVAPIAHVGRCNLTTLQ